MVLFIDHKHLVQVLRSRLHAKFDRQQRHLSVILEYISSAEYIAGSENVVADALSCSFEEPDFSIASFSDSSHDSSPTVPMVFPSVSSYARCFRSVRYWSSSGRSYRNRFF